MFSLTNLPILLLLNFATKEKTDIHMDGAGVVTNDKLGKKAYFIQMGDHRLVFTAEDAVKYVAAITRLIEENPLED